ncbi:ArnT family glycosyltransferase [Fimbriimonas ginsengisoli]|uniref:Glycosyl transferase, family 39 n=1 Tax=Fimbriimonas ginsengisoli Gsoil 348 TaxID=661478 RepID=A0A068NWI1_FIMGI|nr:glycosyltransferase family 39 protein [Fimbriimonas ginsengisoli]AIE87883.1 glycosyl transferase, family 39 [Fimbriimonas ginsengisoli Gsoil 348]
MIDAAPLSRARLRIVLPAGLFLLALLLRLAGIGWGLKNDLHNSSYHPDEPVIWAYSQAIEPSKLNFTPRFYNYGTLYLTVLKVASDMTAAYTGGPDPKNEEASWDYVSRSHMAGRLINALAGSGTVLIVFLILRRFVGDVGASAGGLALAVAPAHVVHSRFQTVDIFAAFLLSISIFYALRLLGNASAEEEANKKSPIKDPVTRDAILSGIFAGLSAGTKYTGILGLIVLLIVLGMRHRPRLIRDGLLGVLTCIVAFVVATPGAVLDTAKFKEGVLFEMAHTATGHGIVFAGTSSGYIYHIGNLINGIGFLIVLTGLAGLAYAAYRRHVWAIALLAFFLVYYFMIGGATDKYMRYTFPLYPAIAVGFGYAVAVGHRRQGSGRILVALGILGLGGADMRGLIGAVRNTGYMLESDPRDTAAKYFKEKPNSVVGLASDPWFWSPPLFKNSPSKLNMARLDEAGNVHPMGLVRDRLRELAATSAPHGVYYLPPDGAHHPFDARLITELKPDYITYSTLESAPRERLMGVTVGPPEAVAAGREYKEFTTALTAAYDLESTVGDPIDSVEDMQYIHPVVYIWKRKK